VVGVEENVPAVQAGKSNAAANHLSHVKFISGSVEEVLSGRKFSQLCKLLWKKNSRSAPPPPPTPCDPDFSSSQPFSEVCVVLDPPRQGCHVAVLDSLIRMRASRIVYVSCDAGTLARDLKRLMASSTSDGQPVYKVIDVTPFDMFPQTKHTETVVVLEARAL
jgi:tRNA/tmRNA/rRNA uracil-C5-methylase (TrmA/RlmC/RlmD family)